MGGCGKKFTTVYNLKAHMKAHEQESLFKCEVCAERFPTHAKLSSHQRSHFEPERPYKCDFPGERRGRGAVSPLLQTRGRGGSRTPAWPRNSSGNLGALPRVRVRPMSETTRRLPTDRAGGRSGHWETLSPACGRAPRAAGTLGRPAAGRDFRAPQGIIARRGASAFYAVKTFVWFGLHCCVKF